MEIFTNFGIQPVLLLAQIVNFLIILLILKKFFYKPITGALDKRRQTIAQSLKNAEEIEKKLQETEIRSAKILDEARDQAQSFITEAKKDAQRINEESNVEAKKTLNAAVEGAQAKIESQKEQMKKEIESETISLVSEVVRKLLNRTLKPEEKAQLTTKSLSEISRGIND